MTELEAEYNLMGLLHRTGMRVLTRQYRIGSKQVDIVATDGVEIISVEVKLRDWKRACVQASLNVGYFDRSYIALPANPRRRLDHDYLRAFGVGLIEFDNERASVIVEAAGRAATPGTLRAVHSRLDA